MERTLLGLLSPGRISCLQVFLSMNVSARCPHCSKVYSVPIGVLGKRTKCTSCGGRFELQEHKETFADDEVDLGSLDQIASPVTAPSSQPSGNMAYCSECGATISRRASACPKCGAPLHASSISTVGSSYGSDTASTNWNPGLTVEMWLLIVATVLIPLVGLIVGVMRIANPQRRQEGITLLGVAVCTIILFILFMNANN